MDNGELVIRRTKNWINEVVVQCNFCPFAVKEVRKNSIHFQVEESPRMDVCLQSFLQECIRLDEDETIETCFLIFPVAFSGFDDYLNLVSMAEKLLKQEDYEGIYQVASFHPDYCFANESPDDAANYTNRSIYPMLHLLREESIEQALLRYADPARIPERNVQFAREKGTAYMKMLRDACFKIP